MNIDLHCHSNASDGHLSPQSLVEYAAGKNIRTLSITDHDTIAAYAGLDHGPLQIVPGIELSSQWRKHGIHIVGLNINLGSSVLIDAITFQNKARMQRAEAIATRLEKQGISGALEGAARIAGNDNIGRPHFARYLVATGTCDSVSDAFNKYLGTGRAGDIHKYWPGIAQVVEWINAAGGIAVLAHPLTYKMTRTKLSALLDEFTAAGGRGMEVISGKQPPHLILDLAKLCQEKKMLASCGSDFHQPDQSWADIGQFPPLPDDCKPVWEYF